MPQPDEQTAPARRSRHAADASPAEMELDGTWNTGEYEAVLREAARHRRPETLADSTRLRPVSVPPSTRRSADSTFDLGHYEDSFIEQGFPEMTKAEQRAEQRRSDAIRLAEQRRTETANQEAESRAAGLLGRFLSRKSDSRATRTKGGKSRGTGAGSDKPDPAPRPGTLVPPRHGPVARVPNQVRPVARVPQQRGPVQQQRGPVQQQRGLVQQRGGKHAAAPAPVITVSPLPAVREALTEGKRAAGSIREWALYSGDKPPVTGGHRAPGTLPIESWLLIGKTRQQVLLASLIAVGLLVIAIPVQRHGTDVNAVNAAERGIAKIDGRSSSVRTATDPAAPSPVSTPTTEPTKASPAAKPSASAPVKATPAKAALPQGGGPGKSLLSTGTDSVALTFDDGPDPVQTPKILALLAKYDVKATFCLIGENVKRHPEIVREIVAAGHTLCNHTWNHSLTIGKDKPAAIQADLERTSDAIRDAVPEAQIPFFRAPGGNFSDRLVSVAADEGMTSLYWRVDPRDWDHPTGEDDATHITKVVDGVREAVRPGSIVLSHDFNQPDTIKAYEQLLPWLTDNFQLGLPPASVTPGASPSSSPSSPASSSSAPSSPVPSSPASPAPSEPLPLEPDN